MESIRVLPAGENEAEVSGQGVETNRFERQPGLLAAVSSPALSDTDECPVGRLLGCAPEAALVDEWAVTPIIRTI